MNTYNDSDVIVEPKTYSDNDVSIESVNTVKPKQSILENLTSKKTEPLGGLQNRLSMLATNPAAMVTAPGLAMSAAGIPEEESFVPVGSILGTFLGSRIGHSNLGAGVGAGTGDVLKQFAEKARGGEKDLNLLNSLLTGGAVAASGKALEVGAKTLGMSGKLIPEKSRAFFFDKALQAVDVGKKTLSRNWDRAVTDLVVKNPDTRINLSGVMTELSHQIKNWGDDSLVPQLKSAVKHSPRLAKAVESPKYAINLTLKEAQELKNAITSTTNSITRSAMKGKTTPNERVVFDILGSIDDKIVEQFPKMIDVKAAYHAGKKAYEMARPLVEAGPAVESAIFSRPQGMFGLGGSKFMGSTHGKLAFETITKATKPGSKVFDEALLAHNLNRAADFVSRAGQIAVGGAIVNKVGGNTLKKVFDN